MATSAYQGVKFEGVRAGHVTDHLTVEGALQININGEPFTVTMRTPGDDPALVHGLFNSEGILKDKTQLLALAFTDPKNKGIITTADVTVDVEQLNSGYANSRSLLSVSSCGICGRTELDPTSTSGQALDEQRTVSMSTIVQMFSLMQEEQNAFKQSGGSHAAAAFDYSGKLLASKEDIGRHNAVDKVVGELILQQQLKTAACLTVSGRVSYEIIIKAFKARIPILCAVSAPSSLAVDFAKELGITLLAFCRDNRATCYANPQRIQTNEQRTVAG